MVSIFLFLAGAFLLVFLLGKVLEKVRVPWIFSALLLGAVLAAWNPFSEITSSKIFEFLALLGMYFLLFMIGLEVDLKRIKSCGKFIFKSTFFIIFFEAIFGTLLVHFVFGYSWVVSVLVALSFATVGEAILIPILDEFKIVNTKLGQSIIGVGTLDDIIEIITLIFAGLLIGVGIYTNYGIISTVISLTVLILLTIGFTRIKRDPKEFKFLSIETLFFFTIFVLFLFIGIGKFSDLAPVAALLAGLSLNAFIPKERIGRVKSGIKILTYGFFAPIFFLWVGLDMNMSYLVKYPLLILLVVAVSKGAKLLGSWSVGRKELGNKGSILLGIGLSVRFSTSIIIIKMLYDAGVVGSDLYSIIVASSIVFKFIIPILFSNLLVKWGFAKKNAKKR